MGCFNTIHFRCPECKSKIEVQTKGGSCRMIDIHSSKVPFGDASYVLGDKLSCEVCNCVFIIDTDRVPETVPLTLVPFFTKESDDED